MTTTITAIDVTMASILKMGALFNLKVEESSIKVVRFNQSKDVSRKFQGST